MTETIPVESSPTEEAIEGTQGAEVSTEMQGAWSEFLKSPDDLSAFSPSGDVGGGNLHGLGKSRKQPIDFLSIDDSCFLTFCHLDA
jgi:hypothetical protein